MQQNIIWFRYNFFNVPRNTFDIYELTHGLIKLHTLLVKYYNDLLGRQNSEWGMNEVTFFYVGDLFCIHFAFSVLVLDFVSCRSFTTTFHLAIWVRVHYQNEFSKTPIKVFTFAVWESNETSNTASAFYTSFTRTYSIWITWRRRQSRSLKFTITA